MNGKKLRHHVHCESFFIFLVLYIWNSIALENDFARIAAAIANHARKNLIDSEKMRLFCRWFALLIHSSIYSCYRMQISTETQTDRDRQRQPERKTTATTHTQRTGYISRMEKLAVKTFSGVIIYLFAKWEMNSIVRHYMDRASSFSEYLSFFSTSVVIVVVVR